MQTLCKFTCGSSDCFFQWKGALGKPLAWVTGNRMSKNPLSTHFPLSFFPQGPSSLCVTAAIATIFVVSVWSWVSYHPLLSVGWLCLPCQTGGSPRESWGRDAEVSLSGPELSPVRMLGRPLLMAISAGTSFWPGKGLVLFIKIK